MQLNNAQKLALKVSKEIRQYFKDKVSNFSTFNIMENPHIEFTICFKAYNYFIINLNYDLGRFGCAIDGGSAGISLENSQKMVRYRRYGCIFKRIGATD